MHMAIFYPYLFWEQYPEIPRIPFYPEYMFLEYVSYPSIRSSWIISGMGRVMQHLTSKKEWSIWSQVYLSQSN